VLLKDGIYTLYNLITFMSSYNGYILLKSNVSVHLKWQKHML